MTSYDEIAPALKNADVLLDGDLVRARWFTEGIPQGPGTLQWLAEISVGNDPEYLLGVETVDGVGRSWVQSLAPGGDTEQVDQPGELELSETGVGTQFPKDALPEVDGSSTYRAILKIDGEQVDVFPKDGSTGKIMTLDD